MGRRKKFPGQSLTDTQRSEIERLYLKPAGDPERLEVDELAKAIGTTGSLVQAYAHYKGLYRRPSFKYNKHVRIKPPGYTREMRARKAAANGGTVLYTGTVDAPKEERITAMILDSEAHIKLAFEGSALDLVVKVIQTFLIR